MRAFLMAAVAMAAFAAPAHAQWTDVAGGKRHDATGLVCPVMTEGLMLKSATGDGKAFSCRYELHCATVDACPDALGFAAVTWNSELDFGAQFRALVERQGLTVTNEAGPAWAGAPEIYARGGEGVNRSGAGMWLLRREGEPLHIAVLWNVGAEKPAQALVEAAARLNP